MADVSFLGWPFFEDRHRALAEALGSGHGRGRGAWGVGRGEGGGFQEGRKYVGV